MTQRQRILLDFISAHWRQNGYGPSYEAMAVAIGAKTRATAFSAVKRMARDGLLEAPPKRHRAVRVPARLSYRDGFEQAIDLVEREGLDDLAQELRTALSVRMATQR